MKALPPVDSNDRLAAFVEAVSIATGVLADEPLPSSDLAPYMACDQAQRRSHLKPEKSWSGISFQNIGEARCLKGNLCISSGSYTLATAYPWEL